MNLKIVNSSILFLKSLVSFLANVSELSDNILSSISKSLFSNLYFMLSEFKFFGFFVNVIRSLSLKTNFLLTLKFIHFFSLHSKIFFNFNKFLEN